MLKKQAGNLAVEISEGSLLGKNQANHEEFFSQNLFEVTLLKNNESFRTFKSHQLEVVTEEKTAAGGKIGFKKINLGELSLEFSYTFTLQAGKFLGELTFFATGNLEAFTLDVVKFFSGTFPAEKLVFSAPTEHVILGTPYSFNTDELLLGQPIYLPGFYLGSRFPANDNYVEKIGEVCQVNIAYYSGEKLSAFKTGFVSWPAILGTTESCDYEGMKAEFLQEIEKIAAKTPLKIQYNSWYEAFMGITEEKFLESSQRMNAFVTKHHLPQFAAYVLDDGWNNYNDPTYTGIDEFRSGTIYNQSGFWEFNDKFPHEAKKISDYLQSIGSTLGMWLGPQGGYELQDTFAEFLEAEGNGSVNHQAALGKAIDVNNGIYLEKLEKILLTYQEKFQLSYWKLDGFASRPNTEYGKDHLVGGRKNRYYTTQLWERWLKIFERMRQLNPEIFINVTCYVPVSPWFLPFVNTIWLQNSGDLEIDGKAAGSLVEQMLTGRDKIYQEKVFVEKLQFPLAHLYNHEPIYGHAVEMNMTGTDFKKYLVGNIFRGTSLWELHLSPDLLDDEKADILGEALAFLQKHKETLKHTTMKKFSQGIYGYLAEGTAESFLYLRNPENQEVTLNLAELPLAFQKAFQAGTLRGIFGSSTDLQISGLQQKIWRIQA